MDLFIFFVGFFTLLLRTCLKAANLLIPFVRVYFRCKTAEWSWIELKPHHSAIDFNEHLITLLLWPGIDVVNHSFALLSVQKFVKLYKHTCEADIESILIACVSHLTFDRSTDAYGVGVLRLGLKIRLFIKNIFFCSKFYAVFIQFNFFFIM